MNVRRAVTLVEMCRLLGEAVSHDEEERKLQRAAQKLDATLVDASRAVYAVVRRTGVSPANAILYASRAIAAHYATIWAAFNERIAEYAVFAQENNWPPFPTPRVLLKPAPFNSGSEEHVTVQRILSTLVVTDADLKLILKSAGVYESVKDLFWGDNGPDMDGLDDLDNLALIITEIMTDLREALLRLKDLSAPTSLGTALANLLREFNAVLPTLRWRTDYMTAFATHWPLVYSRPTLKLMREIRALIHDAQDVENSPDVASVDQTNLSALLLAVEAVETQLRALARQRRRPAP